MSETTFARLFIFATDMIPNVDGNDRRFVIFMHQQAKAIFKHEFFVGYVDIRERSALGICTRREYSQDNAYEKDFFHTDKFWWLKNQG